jgi:hypothetical protein
MDFTFLESYKSFSGGMESQSTGKYVQGVAGLEMDAVWSGVCKERVGAEYGNWRTPETPDSPG